MQDLGQYTLITEALIHTQRNECSENFGKILGKQPVESYFSTVTDLAILLKQDPSTGVFVKTFQN